MRNGIDHEKKKGNGINDKNLKIRIEKGIILAAFLMIITALFLIPKYEAYADNEELLKEKTKIGNELSNKMREEDYLEELGIISEKLEVTRLAIPDRIDSAGIVNEIFQMADAAKVVLISVEFSPIETRIDAGLGKILEKELLENNENSIKGPDGRFLASCEFTIICSGEDVNCISFLEKLAKNQPMIIVNDFEMKGEALKEKTMTLKLKSYGTIQEETKMRINQNGAN